MITDIQNFENAARIATADALLADGNGEHPVPLFARWFLTVCEAFGAGWRAISPVRQG